MSQGKHEVVACYWIILELISRYEKPEDRGFIEIPIKLLARKLFMTCPKVERILTQLSVNLCPTFDHVLTKGSANVASIRVHNWLELQENRGSKTGLKKFENTDRPKTKDLRPRIKNKEAEIKNVQGGSKDPTPASRIRSVFLESWQSEFGKEYPGWGRKENGQAAAWASSVNIEKALEYCRFYPKWNDPWVSRRGHPFGILVAQYVQLDAWMCRPKEIGEKMAKGRAYEKVLIESTQGLEEMKQYAGRNDERTLQRLREEATLYDADFRASRANGTQISVPTTPRLPSTRGDLYGEFPEADPETGDEGA